MTRVAFDLHMLDRPARLIIAASEATRCDTLAYLGSKIPAGAARCTIWVNDIERGWQKGATLIFDDTFMRRVRNDSDEVKSRAVHRFRTTAAMVFGYHQSRFDSTHRADHPGAAAARMAAASTTLTTEIAIHARLWRPA